jgi:flagellar biosynthesis GTPase FlhF
MCVGAALGLSTTAGSGLFGLSAATAFNIGLGLTAANAFAGRAAARDRANQTYNQALIANQSAEADKRQQQLALAEKKSEEEKFAAQDKFAKTIDALQAKSSIVASEQAGTTVGLLLMDQERQAANYREKINQSLESMRRQYLFNVQATESQFESRRNQLQSNINEAYNAIPTLGQTLLNIGTQGVGMYFNALP